MADSRRRAAAAARHHAGCRTGRPALGCDRAVQREGPVAVGPGRQGPGDGRQVADPRWLLRNRRRERLDPDEARTSATSSSISSLRRPSNAEGRQPGARQQRRDPHGPLRDPGARFVRQHHLRRRDGRVDLWRVPAARQRRRGNPANGRATTSSSRRRSSTARRSSRPPTSRSSGTACSCTTGGR